MTNEQQQVKDWMLKFGQETPEKPTTTTHEVRKLRAGLILEEALETIQTLGFCIDYKLNVFTHKDPFNREWFVTSIIDVNGEPTNDIRLSAIADGCEDLKVVTEGTLIACGLAQPKYKQEISNEWGYDNVLVNEDPLFNEVMRSNNSKLWEKADVKSHLAANPDWNGTVLSCAASGQYVMKRDDGKVIKSPSYSPPNLTPIIEALSK